MAKHTITEKITQEWLDRFWSRVNKNAHKGCWEWTGYKTWNGYGAMWMCGKLRKTHRISYELAVGEIPHGMQIDHACSNRSCINPGHLRLATQPENARHKTLQKNNASGFKGAYLDKRLGKWRALIMVNNKRHHLGYFQTPELAHAAYCDAAVRLHGDFASCGVAK